MPLYSFICLGCKTKGGYIHPMKKCDMVHKCPKCGFKMVRDFQADIPFASGGDYGSRAIHSDSLAIAPSQRAEHEKLFPDITLDNQNRPVFDKFSSHEKYLKQCNLVKERKKIKPKGVRIA